VSEPKRYIPYIAFENMAYPFPAMREVDANWKQYADVKMAYVTDADYARLKAEVERLTKERDKALTDFWYIHEGYFRLQSEVNRLTAFTTRTIIPNEELQAQVERLTKAGDAMADSINGDYNYSLPCIEAWKAAKEGKPKNSKDALEFIHTLDSLAIKKQKEEIERLCAWGRGLESDLSHARVEISFLKAESERLKEDNRQLTNAFEIAEGIIKRMGKAAEAAAKEGKPSV
jgi:hypothetical protein